MKAKVDILKTKSVIRILMVCILSLAFITANAQRHHRNEKRNDPHYRYAKLPHWGYSYKTAPKKAFIIAHSGVKYHYSSGIFYKPVGTNYTIVKAPAGLRVRSLPKEKIRFFINGKRYYYYYGTFYIESSDSDDFITVDPPKGARVDALPDGYRKVVVDGNEYYEFEGTYYKAVINENDEEWYEVIGEKN